MAKIRYVRYDEKNGSQIVRRHITYPPAVGCARCGNFNGFGGLWEYGVRANGMPDKDTFWIGHFCSMPCFDRRDEV